MKPNKTKPIYQALRNAHSHTLTTAPCVCVNISISYECCGQLKANVQFKCNDEFSIISFVGKKAVQIKSHFRYRGLRHVLTEIIIFWWLRISWKVFLLIHCTLFSSWWMCESERIARNCNYDSIRLSFFFSRHCTPHYTHFK